MLDYHDLAVIGLGPGGLVACLEAAKAGHQVLAFSDRTKYTRGQRVRLDAETSEYLEKEIDSSDPIDLDFHHILDTEASVQIKDIERFLAHKLQPYIESGQIRMVRLDRNERADMHLEQQADAVIIDFHGEKFHCHHLLAADGIHRNFAALMNKELKTSIRFEPSSDQPRHQYHAAVQIRLRFPACQKLRSTINPRTMTKAELQTLCQDKDTCIFYHDRYYYFRPGQETKFLTNIPAFANSELRNLFRELRDDTPVEATFKELSVFSQVIPEREITPLESSPTITPFLDLTKSRMQQGWRQEFSPFSYCVYNRDINKFFIAGEIPKIIFEEPDVDKQRAMLKSWFYPTIKELYPVSIDALEYRHSRPTDVGVFKTEIQTTTTPIIDLAHGGVFAQIGDARRSPYYVKGHGLNHAIQGAQAFVEGMLPDYDKRPFLEAIEKFDRDIQDPEIELSEAAKKLSVALERLIKHLERLNAPDIPQESIQMLKIGKQKINLMDFDEVELALKEISHLIQKKAQATPELKYACWRGLKQLFNAKANTSMMLLEKTENLLQRARYRF